MSRASQRRKRLYRAVIRAYADAPVASRSQTGRFHTTKGTTTYLASRPDIAWKEVLARVGAQREQFVQASDLGRRHDMPVMVDVKALRTTARLSQEQLAHLLGVSWSTVSRWERGIATPMSDIEAQLHRLAETVECIGDMIAPDTMYRFLLTPHPLLRGHRPVDLLKNDYGLEALLDFIEGAKSGDMA